MLEAARHPWLCDSKREKLQHGFKAESYKYSGWIPEETIGSWSAAVVKSGKDMVMYDHNVVALAARYQQAP